MDIVKNYNDMTEEAFGQLWRDNLEKNRKYIAQGLPLKKTKDSCCIIGAGPSLDVSFNFIKTSLIAVNPFVICVDSAVRPLVRAGIRPDAVITIDPRKDTRHFVGAVKHTPLIAYTTSNPEVLAWHQGSKIFINNGSCMHGEHPDLFVPGLPLVGCGGNVATVALALAEDIGYQHMLMFGVDLWAEGNNTYASGCLREGLPAKDIGVGGLRIGRAWIESFLADHPKVDLINVTRYGLRIKGAENITL